MTLVRDGLCWRDRLNASSTSIEKYLHSWSTIDYAKETVSNETRLDMIDADSVRGSRMCIKSQSDPMSNP